MSAASAAASADAPIASPEELIETLTEFNAKNELLSQAASQVKPIRAAQRSRKDRMLEYMKRTQTEKIYFDDFKRAMVLKCRNKKVKQSSEDIVRRMRSVMSENADRDPEEIATKLHDALYVNAPSEKAYSLAFTTTPFGKALAKTEAPTGDRIEAAKAHALQVLESHRQEVGNGAMSI